MNPKEHEQNKPNGLTRREFLRRAGAVALGTAAGLVLPDALKKTAEADGSVGEVQYKYRAFVPRVLKDISGQKLDEAERPPLYLREFGAPERGVIMRNKVEQGGGNPAYVEMGDPELFENMMYLREKYGTDLELKKEINFYQSTAHLNRSSGISPYDPNYKLIPYGFWTETVPIFDDQGNFLYTRTYPPAFRTGIVRWKLRPDGVLDFHMTLPEAVKAEVIPEERQVNWMHAIFVEYLRDAVFLTDKTGKTTSLVRRPGSPESVEFNTHPDVRIERGRVVGSALWIRMQTKENTEQPGK